MAINYLKLQNGIWTLVEEPPTAKGANAEIYGAQGTQGPDGYAGTNGTDAEFSALSQRIYLLQISQLINVTLSENNLNDFYGGGFIDMTEVFKSFPYGVTSYTLNFGGLFKGISVDLMDQNLNILASISEPTNVWTYDASYFTLSTTYSGYIGIMAGALFDGLCTGIEVYVQYATLGGG